MLRVLSVCMLLSWLMSACADPEMSFGKFEGTVKAEWLRGTPDERRMQLLENFTYIDPHGKRWVSQRGNKTDGATIPQATWSLVGGPFDGQYREAAVIHDAYCDSKTEPWRDVHRIFYYANRAAGVSELKAKILYGGVMLGGPKWGSNKSKCYSNCHALDTQTYRNDNKGRLTNFPRVSEGDYRKIAEWISQSNPKIEEIDAYVKQNFPNSSFGHE